MYLHYVADSIYITYKVTVDDFLLCFAYETFLSVQQCSANILGPNLLWYPFNCRNVLVKWLSVLIAHCPEIFEKSK
jgi:hypothetical protein